MDNDEITFSRDELVEALLKTSKYSIDENSDIWTGPELAEEVGLSSGTVARRMKQLLSRGIVEVAQKRKLNMLGDVCTVKGYRLVKSDE